MQSIAVRRVRLFTRWSFQTPPLPAQSGWSTRYASGAAGVGEGSDGEDRQRDPSIAPGALRATSIPEPVTGLSVAEAVSMDSAVAAIRSLGDVEPGVDVVREGASDEEEESRAGLWETDSGASESEMYEFAVRGHEGVMTEDEVAEASRMDEDALRERLQRALGEADSAGSRAQAAPVEYYDEESDGSGEYSTASTSAEGAYSSSRYSSYGTYSYESDASASASYESSTSVSASYESSASVSASSTARSSSSSHEDVSESPPANRPPPLDPSGADRIRVVGESDSDVARIAAEIDAMSTVDCSYEYVTYDSDYDYDASADDSSDPPARRLPDPGTDPSRLAADSPADSRSAPDAPFPEQAAAAAAAAASTAAVGPTRDAAGTARAAGKARELPAGWRRSTFDGVVVSPDGQYFVRAELGGRAVDAGPFPMALQAAEAYDAAAREAGMAGAANVPAPDLAAEWRTPAKREEPPGIPVVPGQRVRGREIVEAFEAEGAVDVRLLDLRGKAALCNEMVLATGKSVAHMRRLADMVVKAHRARRLPRSGKVLVEGRDTTDWMVVDLSDVIVNLFDERGRRTYDLDTLWGEVEEYGADEVERRRMAEMGDENDPENDNACVLYPIPNDHSPLHEMHEEEVKGKVERDRELRGARVVHAPKKQMPREEEEAAAEEESYTELDVPTPRRKPRRRR